MKFLIPICLCLVWCSVGFANDGPKMITLAPGDQLLITVEDDAQASLAPVTAKAVATKAPTPIGFDDVREDFEQVCVDGVCTWQPVRRALNRTKNIVSDQASPLRSIMVRSDPSSCGCDCPNCNCQPAATDLAGPSRESRVSYSVGTSQRVRATRTIRLPAPLQTLRQNRRNP